MYEGSFALIHIDVIYYMYSSLYSIVENKRMIIL